MDYRKVMEKIIKGFIEANKGSLLRTLVFTLGHFIIAATILKILDPGIEMWVAITDAIVEPLVNSLWYYVLDRVWITKVVDGL
tara:strand:- start:186 stop:434 length:249 start_codon:yes stop_codon:yes gene_type:complete